VAATLQLRHEPVPVQRLTAGPGDQHERRHTGFDGAVPRKSSVCNSSVAKRNSGDTSPTQPLPTVDGEALSKGRRP